MALVSRSFGLLLIGLLAALLLPQAQLHAQTQPDHDNLEAVSPVPSYESSVRGTVQPPSETLGALRVYSHPGPVLALVFSPTASLLATGDASGYLRVWPLGAEELVQTVAAHKKAIQALAFSPDGSVLATGGGDGLVRVWETPCQARGKDGADKERPRFERGAICPQSWLETRHRGPVTALAFSPDGSTLLSGSTDDAVFHRDVITGNRLVSYYGHSADITGLAMPAVGSCAISGSDDRSLQGWNTVSGEQLDFSTQSRRVTTIALTRAGDRLASGMQDGVISLRRTQNCQVHTVALRLDFHQQTVRALAFSPDGRWLFSAGDDRRIVRWDVERGVPVQVFIGHQERITALSVSSDGSLLASGSRDHSVRVWRLAEQTPFDKVARVAPPLSPPRGTGSSHALEPTAQARPAPQKPEDDAARPLAGPSPD